MIERFRNERKLQDESLLASDNTWNEPSPHLKDATFQNDYGYTGNLEYNVDYFYRPPEDDTYKECKIPGVTSSVCVPRDVIANETEFCYDKNYDFICVPVLHFLWPFWTVAQKDFEVQEKVSLQVEQRLLLELARPFSQES